MVYVFYDDGTYKKVKTLTKKYINASWYLIDISTDRKGPVFTVVEDVNLDFKNDNIMIAYDTTYAPYDLPFDENTTIHNEFRVKSLENYYNVYPLIKQLFGYNHYRDSMLETMSCININSVDIKYRKTSVHLDEGTSEKSIRKTFQHMNMLTNVSIVTEYGHNYYDYDILDIVILKKKKWEKHRIMNDSDGYSELLSMRWEQVIIPIPELESCYLMSYEDFLLFANAYDIQICISYDDEFRNDDAIFETNIYTIYDFIYACMYFPQLFLMERYLYEEEFTIILKVEIFDKSLELRIVGAEIDDPRNTCIYDLFRKLIRLQL